MDQSVRLSCGRRQALLPSEGNPKLHEIMTVDAHLNVTFHVVRTCLRWTMIEIGRPINLREFAVLDGYILAVVKHLGQEVQW